MNADSAEKCASSVNDCSDSFQIELPNGMSPTKSEDKNSSKVCRTCCTKCTNPYSIKMLDEILIHCKHCSRTTFIVYPMIAMCCRLGPLVLCPLILKTVINSICEKLSFNNINLDMYYILALSRQPDDTENTKVIKSTLATLILALSIFIAIYIDLSIRNVERTSFTIKDCIKEIRDIIHKHTEYERSLVRKLIIKISQLARFSRAVCPNKMDTIDQCTGGKSIDESTIKIDLQVI